MNLEGIDLVKLSKLFSQQVDQISCLECCKYYIAPETANCGHTLCHNCWSGRKTCPLCKLPVERRQIRVNLPIQKLTEHVQCLVEAYEKLFNVKLDEFLLDSIDEIENDPTKNVKDWLASSQNHFSAPAQSSDPSTQDMIHSNPLEVSSSKIQVHAPTKKTISPEKVVHVSIPQDDWDKIETIPATGNVHKDKENIIGPMDIEPFYIDNNEYTVNNPRRSSRKKELKNNDANYNTYNNSLLEKENPKDSSCETDKKSANTKQNWNNVKKMRKEFSKLNKINRNKLNVSIEMCKKTQSIAKPNALLQNTNTHQVYEIDDNTPKFTLSDLPDIEMANADDNTNHNDKEEITNSKITPKANLHDSKCNASDLHNQLSKEISQSVPDTQLRSISNQVKESPSHIGEPEKEMQAKMPFYKKSALCISDLTQQFAQAVTETNPIQTINHNIESNSNTNEDIEITIKVGNTITNIVIKNKNDVQLKVNTDREVQTSLIPQEQGSTQSAQEMEMRNVTINIDSNNDFNIEHKKISQEINKPITPEIEKQVVSLKSSEKKNTASADTGTGQFEITESVEKELSNIMECAEIEDQKKAKSVPPTSKKTQIISHMPHSNPEKPSQKAETPKPLSVPEKTIQTNTPKSKKVAKSQQINTQEDLDYLNDLDIFESDTVKEPNVQLLKNTKDTPSEILLSTAHNRNKTQKTEKRAKRDTNEDLPKNKKQKLDNTREVNKTNDFPSQSKQRQPESESINYDSIMGQVFASIDADMEEIQSQNIISQKFPNNRNISIKDKGTQNVKAGCRAQEVAETQKQVVSGKYGIDCSALNSNDFCNQKNSENIFSICAEKDVIEGSAPKGQVLLTEPPNLDFLTPVMRNPESTDAALVESKVIEIGNDDSESVVEDTPQKETSFGKLKQKSNGSNNLTSLQRIATESRVPSDKSVDYQAGSDKNIVNLADISEIKNANNLTAIDTKKTTLETPLTINKFVNHIQHNSTPVARKSLNFESEVVDDIDPEQTLCPTNDVIVKTTLEKEIMRKAFEKTPTTQVVKPLNRNLGGRGNKKYCIAGSCLSSVEVAKLKALCSQYKWSYVEKYTRDLTHLVVGVKENKSQRSVKYMCALAASKWIVSSEWVEKCLETKNVVGEEKFEVLDSTGEPGPRRSRVANKRLFQGITFYCMEPFSILDEGTLKEILETSGGRVVNEVKEVRVTDRSSGPAILLAEPEQTQEDRFIYLAMEKSIVPVNYEWVLNCLGSYTLGSFHELLLCPSSLLPKATAKWPQELTAREDD